MRQNAKTDITVNVEQMPLSFYVASNNSQIFQEVETNDLLIVASSNNQSIHIGQRGDDRPSITVDKNHIVMRKPVYLTSDLRNQGPFKIGQLEVNNCNLTVNGLKANYVQFESRLLNNNWAIDMQSPDYTYIKKTFSSITPITISTTCLGINNTMPTTNLDVTGSSRISGDMEILGSLVVRGQTIIDQTVIPPEIGSNYIRTSMLSDEAVTWDKIEYRGIISDRLNNIIEIEQLYVTRFYPQDNNVTIGSETERFNSIYLTSGVQIGPVLLSLANNTLSFSSLDSNVHTPFSLNSNAVLTHMIAPAQVTNSRMAPNAVTNDKIAPNAVRATHILNGEITTNKLFTMAVSHEKLAIDSVRELNVKESSISTIKIANRAVTAAKIGFSAVLEEHVMDSNITLEKMAEESVSTIHIVPESIRSNLIAPANIKLSHMAAASVSNAQLAPKSITADKIADSFISELTAQVTSILPGTIGNTEIADNSITMSKIQAVTVQPYHLGFTILDQVEPGSINYDKLNNALFYQIKELGWNIDQDKPLLKLNDTNLTVAGDIYAANVGTPSDMSIKSDLQPIQNALEKLLTLTGYTYQVKGSEKRQTGLIAQHVESVLPEAVVAVDETKALLYGNLMGLVVEAIKELYHKLSD